MTSFFSLSDIPAEGSTTEPTNNNNDNDDNSSTQKETESKRSQSQEKSSSFAAQPFVSIVAQNEPPPCERKQQHQYRRGASRRRISASCNYNTSETYSSRRKDVLSKRNEEFTRLLEQKQARRKMYEERCDELRRCASMATQQDSQQKVVWTLEEKWMCHVMTAVLFDSCFSRVGRQIVAKKRLQFVLFPLMMLKARRHQKGKIIEKCKEKLKKIGTMDLARSSPLLTKWPPSHLAKLQQLMKPMAFIQNQCLFIRGEKGAQSLVYFVVEGSLQERNKATTTTTAAAASGLESLSSERGGGRSPLFDELAQSHLPSSERGGGCSNNTSSIAGGGSGVVAGSGIGGGMPITGVAANNRESRRRSSSSTINFSAEQFDDIGRSQSEQQQKQQDDDPPLPVQLWPPPPQQQSQGGEKGSTYYHSNNNGGTSKRRSVVVLEEEEEEKQGNESEERNLNTDNERHKKTKEKMERRKKEKEKKNRRENDGASERKEGDVEDNSTCNSTRNMATKRYKKSKKEKKNAMEKGSDSPTEKESYQLAGVQSVTSRLITGEDGGDSDSPLSTSSTSDSTSNFDSESEREEERNNASDTEIRQEKDDEHKEGEERETSGPNQPQEQGESSSSPTTTAADDRAFLGTTSATQQEQLLSSQNTPPKRRRRRSSASIPEIDPSCWTHGSPDIIGKVATTGRLMGEYTALMGDVHRYTTRVKSEECVVLAVSAKSFIHLVNTLPAHILNDTNIIVRSKFRDRLLTYNYPTYDQLRESHSFFRLWTDDALAHALRGVMPGVCREGEKLVRNIYATPRVFFIHFGTLKLVDPKGKQKGEELTEGQSVGCESVVRMSLPEEEISAVATFFTEYWSFATADLCQIMHQFNLQDRVIGEARSMLATRIPACSSEHLRKSAIFGMLTERMLNSLADRFTLTITTPQEVLAREGLPISHAFVVASGTIDLMVYEARETGGGGGGTGGGISGTSTGGDSNMMKGGPIGRRSRRTVQELHDGQPFGLPELMGEASPTYSAISPFSAVIYCITRDEIVETIKEEYAGSTGNNILVAMLRKAQSLVGDRMSQSQHVSLAEVLKEMEGDRSYGADQMSEKERLEKAKAICKQRALEYRKNHVLPNEGRRVNEFGIEIPLSGRELRMRRLREETLEAHRKKFYQLQKFNVEHRVFAALSKQIFGETSRNPQDIKRLEHYKEPIDNNKPKPVFLSEPSQFITTVAKSGAVSTIQTEGGRCLLPTATHSETTQQQQPSQRTLERGKEGEGSVGFLPHAPPPPPKEEDQVEKRVPKEKETENQDGTAVASFQQQGQTTSITTTGLQSFQKPFSSPITPEGKQLSSSRGKDEGIAYRGRGGRGPNLQESAMKKSGGNQQQRDRKKKMLPELLPSHISLSVGELKVPMEHSAAQPPPLHSSLKGKERKEEEESRHNNSNFDDGSGREKAGFWTIDFYGNTVWVGGIHEEEELLKEQEEHMKSIHDRRISKAYVQKQKNNHNNGGSCLSQGGGAKKKKMHSYIDDPMGGLASVLLAPREQQEKEEDLKLNNAKKEKASTTKAEGQQQGETSMGAHPHFPMPPPQQPHQQQFVAPGAAAATGAELAHDDHRDDTNKNKTEKEVEEEEIDWGIPSTNPPPLKEEKCTSNEQEGKDQHTTTTAPVAPPDSLKELLLAETGALPYAKKKAPPAAHPHHILTTTAGAVIESENDMEFLEESKKREVTDIANKKKKLISQENKNKNKQKEKQQSNKNSPLPHALQQQISKDNNDHKVHYSLRTAQDSSASQFRSTHAKAMRFFKELEEVKLIGRKQLNALRSEEFSRANILERRKNEREEMEKKDILSTDDHGQGSSSFLPNLHHVSTEKEEARIAAVSQIPKLNTDMLSQQMDYGAKLAQDRQAAAGADDVSSGEMNVAQQQQQEEAEQQESIGHDVYYSARPFIESTQQQQQSNGIPSQLAQTARGVDQQQQQQQQQSSSRMPAPPPPQRASVGYSKKKVIERYRGAHRPTTRPSKTQLVSVTSSLSRDVLNQVAKKRMEEQQLSLRL